MDFTPRKLPPGQHQCNGWARNSGSEYKRCERKMMCKRFISREHRYFFYYCHDHCKYALGEEFPHSKFKSIAVYSACKGKIYPQYQGIVDKEYIDPHFRSNDANLPDIRGRSRRIAAIPVREAGVKLTISNDLRPAPSATTVPSASQDSAVVDEVIKLLDSVPEVKVKTEPQPPPRLVIITPSGRMVNRNNFTSNSQPYQAPLPEKPAQIIWKMYLQRNPEPVPPPAPDNRFKFIGL